VMMAVVRTVPAIAIAVRPGRQHDNRKDYEREDRENKEAVMSHQRQDNDDQEDDTKSPQKRVNIPVLGAWRLRRIIVIRRLSLRPTLIVIGLVRGRRAGVFRVRIRRNIPLVIWVPVRIIRVRIIGIRIHYNPALSTLLLLRPQAFTYSMTLFLPNMFHCF